MHYAIKFISSFFSMTSKLQVNNLVFSEYAGTRAFASGDFSPQGLTENLDGLSLEDIQKISDWVNFYHKQYTYKGKESH